jgi:hypothetical protein
VRGEVEYEDQMLEHENQHPQYSAGGFVVDEVTGELVGSCVTVNPPVPFCQVCERRARRLAEGVGRRGA